MISWLVNKGFFRNANHAIWFLCSSVFFAVLAGWRFAIDWTTLALLVAVIAHVPPLITSAYIVARKQESDVYSKDCIWFNAGMLVLYAILVTMPK
jgi:hypothetical protein